MNERLLQFIWQHQYFAMSDLRTTTGETVHILNQGGINTDQGPDFSNAKIKIGNTIWVGTVELHLNSADWDKHLHQFDANYTNVILHVVWEENGWNYLVPVLELKGRVPGVLLKRYAAMLNSGSFIPCEMSIVSVNELTWSSWKDRLLAERLERKSAIVQLYQSANGNHWEETCWWLIARNFGIRVNADVFEAVARSLPLSILAKHKNQLLALEALLFGQAGLLEQDRREDGYYTLLQREYRFYRHKYNLRPVALPVHFLRMRPGNFPTIRLAQLASLIHRSDALFRKIREVDSVKEIRRMFDVTANDYWHYHYSFDQASLYKVKKLGEEMTDNLIINSVCLILFSWGLYHNEQKAKEKALQWLEQTTAESNVIMKGFLQCGLTVKNAMDSQTLLELKHEYCEKKRCLECAVGTTLLGNAEQ